MNAVRGIVFIFLVKYVWNCLERLSASSYTIASGAKNMKPGPSSAIPASGGAGREGLARGLAIDVAPIRINCVSLNAIHIELFARAENERDTEMVET